MQEAWKAKKWASRLFFQAQNLTIKHLKQLQVRFPILHLPSCSSVLSMCEECLVLMVQLLNMEASSLHSRCRLNSKPLLLTSEASRWAILRSFRQNLKWAPLGMHGGRSRLDKIGVGTPAESSCWSFDNGSIACREVSANPSTGPEIHQEPTWQLKLKIPRQIPQRLLQVTEEKNCNYCKICNFFSKYLQPNEQKRKRMSAKAMRTSSKGNCTLRVCPQKLIQRNEIFQ